MYGVLATEPPQPQYVCKNYGKSCKVHAMADVITSASKSLDADSFSTYDDIEICRQPASSFYQFFSQDDDAPSLTCLLVAASRLIAELSQTRAELQKAQEEISRPRLQASSRTIHSDSSLDKLQSLDFLFAAHSFTSWIKSQLMIQLIVAEFIR
ncbi:hypothetical protein BCV72DRAFT_337515 [Rhizopus microsporus var. microsporus]|uniref:Uncharacterized protein n=1 Tax=Rhizopus microsporus var. microsporus TaxID=86635 RepID=A0A1X0QWJ5_RHIZD|nr:hypothetical protein BCV72DRAFT_337515 [Rhizopus microsporus var. microsporus]